ncbi:hypothetical protein BH23VER1_BH23VER1_02910 [soil metagenome]
MPKPPFSAILLVAACQAVLLSGAFAVTATYRYYRFTPSELRGPNPNSVQLSELEMLFMGSTVFGAVATNPGGNNPNAEQPPNAVDADTSTKWLDFNMGPLVLDFGVPVDIDAYRFATANDAPARDPVSFRLEGSDDQIDWDLLSNIVDFATPTDRFTYTPEIPLDENSPPFVQSFTRDTGLIVRAGDPVVLSWVAPTATMVTIEPGGISEAGAEGSVVVMPTEDTTYTLIASNALGSDTATVEVRTVAAGGSATHQFFRFTPLQLRSETTLNGGIQNSELVLKNGAAEVTGAFATNPGGLNPANETVDRLLDADTATKWLDFNILPVVLDFGSPVTVDSFTFATANDSAWRDPISFGLEGSDDGTTWVPLSLVVNYPTPTARFTFIQDVPLDGADVPPYVRRFVSDSPSYVAGEPVDLAWVTWAADSAAIDQGVGTIPTDGETTVQPDFTTTYTITATNSGGTASAANTVTEVFPFVTTIAYPDFEAADAEIALLGSATLTTDAGIAQPGFLRRLRLTSNGANQIGTAWFRIRQPVQAGFETRFDLQFSYARGGSGEHLAFMIQDTGAGSGLFTTGFEAAGADFGHFPRRLSLRFDSRQQGGDPSSAFVRLSHGIETLATADLTQFPSITSLHPSVSEPDISQAPTLSQLEGDGPVYSVRVVYTPGDFDVYFDGVLVFDSLPLDLQSLGVTDAAGTAFLGFAGRNTGQRENHDVTAWTFGSLPPEGFQIQEVSLAGDIITLTWTSEPGASYEIERSPDLISWIPEDGSVPSQGTTTTAPVPTSAATDIEFFRIVELPNP